MSKIAVCGDLHGNWDVLNEFIEVKQPNIILQCGDFGYWPNMWKRYSQLNIARIKNGDTKVYWCDGNHEHHERLRFIKRHEIRPNVFYMKRGNVLTLPDGRNVLFMGGADSVDKLNRTRGYDWFPEELLTITDLYNIPKDKKIDIVISHTVPMVFNIEEQMHFNYRLTEPSRKILDVVLDEYRPSLWFAGHWHEHMKGNVLGCEWTVLNECKSVNWWTWI